MPRGIRNYRGGTKSVKDKETPHFQDYGNTRGSETLPWGGRSATQEEVDSVRNHTQRQQAERMSTQEWHEEAAANAAARLRNQADFGERPPVNRSRRRVNVQR